MKSRVIAGAALVLIAVVALAVACGGDGNGDGNGDEVGIRTRQGLGVAARAAGGGGGAPSADPAPQLALQAQQITEADLQPVVDAIVAAGVPAGDVEVIVTPYYGDPYYGGGAPVPAPVGDGG